MSDYSAIPAVPCIPGCTDCCGPVPFTEAEWEATGRPIEDGFAMKRRGPRRTEITTTILSAKRDEDGQPLADCLFADGGCTIYDHRPLVCRLFGACYELECPHGRRSRPLLKHAAVRELMNEREAARS